MKSTGTAYLVWCGCFRVFDCIVSTPEHRHRDHLFLVRDLRDRSIVGPGARSPARADGQSRFEAAVRRVRGTHRTGDEGWVVSGPGGPVPDTPVERSICYLSTPIGRGGGAVELALIENRYGLRVIVGSNPTLSVPGSYDAADPRRPVRSGNAEPRPGFPFRSGSTPAIHPAARSPPARSILEDPEFHAGRDRLLDGGLELAIPAPHHDLLDDHAHGSHPGATGSMPTVATHAIATTPHARTTAAERGGLGFVLADGCDRRRASSGPQKPIRRPRRSPPRRHRGCAIPPPRRRSRDRWRPLPRSGDLRSRHGEGGRDVVVGRGQTLGPSMADRLPTRPAAKFGVAEIEPDGGILDAVLDEHPPEIGVAAEAACASEEPAMPSMPSRYACSASPHGSAPCRRRRRPRTHRRARRPRPRASRPPSRSTTGSFVASVPRRTKSVEIAHQHRGLLKQGPVVPVGRSVVSGGFGPSKGPIRVASTCSGRPAPGPGRPGRERPAGRWSRPATSSHNARSTRSAAARQSFEFGQGLDLARPARVSSGCSRRCRRRRTSHRRGERDRRRDRDRHRPRESPWTVVVDPGDIDGTIRPQRIVDPWCVLEPTRPDLRLERQIEVETFSTPDRHRCGSGDHVAPSSGSKLGAIAGISVDRRAPVEGSR